MTTETTSLEDALDTAVEWLQSQRDRLRFRAEPLSREQRAALQPYFDAALLDDARVLLMDRLSLIDDAVIRAHFPGDALPIDLQRITGLTLVDTVCIGRNGLRHADELLPVLFQELVHMAQFRRLGVRGFLARYLAGWASQGRRHDDIPIERQALALRQRFVSDPSVPFSVHQELDHVD